MPIYMLAVNWRRCHTDSASVYSRIEIRPGHCENFYYRIKGLENMYGVHLIWQIAHKDLLVEAEIYSLDKDCKTAASKN